MNVPSLVCHGTNDETIAADNAYKLKETAKHAELFLVKSRSCIWQKTSVAVPASVKANAGSDWQNNSIFKLG